MRPRLPKRHRTEPAEFDAAGDHELVAAPAGVVESPAERRFEAVLARELDRSGRLASSDDPALDRRPDIDRRPDTDSSDRGSSDIGSSDSVDPPALGVPGADRVDFWERFDRARAEAQLHAIPPAAVTAVVGPLAAALPVARRCQTQHWMGSCDVFVLSETAKGVPGHPDWQMVDTPARLISILEDAASDFPLLVIDVPTNLPRLVEPLIRRLRTAGVGLVHYVLDGDPDDEDLATWYGVLGGPSVLNLAGPLTPDRVIELVDQGEPEVSVAGRLLTAELLVALRTWSNGNP